MKTEYSENNSYEWYRIHVDLLYLDACFVFAIRSACHLNVLEPQKAVDNCDIVLKEDKTNLRTLYEYYTRRHEQYPREKKYEFELIQ
ncbi:unnamed protein product [Rotaria sp. Silwood1]|nr:unnamed protein product [Rotaria sp. Silwood1]